MFKKIIIFLFFLLVNLEIPLVFGDAGDFTNEELLKMGERIYNVKGANTCLMCHGPQGQGGSVPGATHLNQPKQWYIYKALGGDQEFKKNPDQFLKNMETIHTALIQYGSVHWNQEQKNLHPDIQLNFSKTDKPNGHLDPLMYGIMQAPTLREIAKIRKEIQKQKGIQLKKQQMHHLSAKAVYQYIKTFDQGGPKGEVFNPKSS